MPPHILILPGEEYIPARSPLAGIFQRHQIEALRASGPEQIGVISVRLRYSVPMVLKAVLFRFFGQRVNNELGDLGMVPLLRSLWQRWVHPISTIVEEDHGGVSVLRIEGMYGTPPSDRLDPVWWQRAGWQAYRAYVVRYGQPDLIHAHNAVSAGLLAQRIKVRDGIPYVLTEHSSYYHQDRVPVGLFPKVRKAIANASAFLPVSMALFQSLETRMGGLGVTPRVFGNVLPPLFNDLPLEKRTDGPVNFLTVGNLLPVKNQAALIGAFARVLKTLPDAALRICGDGPDRFLLEKQAERLGIIPHVTFLGELDQPGVLQEMQRANVFVLPSRFETFGVVLIEAMATGLPVVAMAIGGPEEIVTEETGRLVSPGDVPGLANAMIHVAGNPQLYDPARIKAHVQSIWAPEVFCRKLREVYADALAGKTIPTQEKLHDSPA